MTTLKFLNVTFDDHTKSEGHWSQICEHCKAENTSLVPFISYGGTGICGVKNCNSESDYYIDLSSHNTSLDVFLGISNSTDASEDIPDLFHIHIDCTLKAHIYALATAVQSLNVVSIHDSNFHGTWSSDLAHCFNLSNVCADISSSLIDFNDNEQHVSLERLVVTQDEFYFTANPKHLSQCGLFTNRVLIKALENTAPNIIIL